MLTERDTSVQPTSSLGKIVLVKKAKIMHFNLNHFSQILTKVETAGMTFSMDWWIGAYFNGLPVSRKHICPNTKKIMVKEEEEKRNKNVDSRKGSTIDCKEVNCKELSPF
jgi:hypothetical protein